MFTSFSSRAAQLALATLASVALIGCATSSSTPTATAPTSTSVQVYETTADGKSLLAQQTAATFSTTPGAGSYTIQVTPATTLQPWDGVGAAMTDSSATVLAALPSAQQQTVMQQLFTQTNGIGLNMVRLPMGATDFTASGNYSYDDVATGSTDTTLANFSIAHDMTSIIPLLTSAQTLNSNLKIIATPWSPPAWMKTNKSMNGVSGASTTTSQIITADFPYLANYFVKFIQAYKAQGLPIYAISPQNEPLNSNSGYPSAILTPSDEATFIATYLGPALSTAGLSSTTKIFGLEDNWADTSYAQTLLQSAASNYIAGTSFHWYEGTVSGQSTVHLLDTAKGIWFTESTGTITCAVKGSCPVLTSSSFSGSGFKYAMQNLIMGVPQNFGRSAIAWNLALNQNEGPQNNGCYTCVGVVTLDTSTSPTSVYFNNMYYALGHIGKFVTPGAYVISTTAGTTSGVQSIGFSNPDGTLVVVAFNGGSSSATTTISWNSKSFDYTIPAGAAVTFKWSSI